MTNLVSHFRVFIYGSYSVLVHLAEDDRGKLPFSSLSMIFVIELVKVRSLIKIGRS